MENLFKVQLIQLQISTQQLYETNPKKPLINGLQQIIRTYFHHNSNKSNTHP
ncbi:hypothetical protein MCEMSEM29_01972 [Methylophilaceae bacterium]